MNNRPLIFYFPYRGVGGVSALFLRLAETLKNYYPIYLADFSDGYMACNKPDGVSLINIDSNPQFPENSVFVFQSFLPWRFPFLYLVPENCKILFWGLHPQNFDPQIFNEHHRKAIIALPAKVINFLALWRRQKLKKVVEYLQAKHGIVFQGRENVAATEHYLRFSITAPVFLPVPVPAANIYKEQPPVFPKRLECAWIGRICDFKYRILEHIIARLETASEKVGPIRLTIIGDGEYRKYLEDSSSLYVTGNFTVDFKGEMPLSSIPSYLVENIDVLFAMGTSAMEGARVGVPVFLADFSYTKITRNYRFKHFFDNSGYCLGEEITENHYEDTSSLEDSLSKVMINYTKYATMSHDYWAHNFSIESAHENLLKYIASTTATFGEMAELGFFKPDFFGQALRSLSTLFRKDLAAKVVGFRHDC